MIAFSPPPPPFLLPRCSQNEPCMTLIYNAVIRPRYAVHLKPRPCTCEEANADTFRLPLSVFKKIVQPCHGTADKKLSGNAAYHAFFCVACPVRFARPCITCNLHCCLHCSIWSVGDERHYLAECPILDEIRAHSTFCLVALHVTCAVLVAQGPTGCL